VSGPFYLPSGAINSYTLQDNGGYDLMDVTVVDDSFGNCDFTFDGYPYSDVFLSSSFFSGSTGEVQSGFYDFWARCNNSVADCQFSLDWTANY
jgi:hypothetical protein